MAEILLEKCPTASSFALPPDYLEKTALLLVLGQSLESTASAKFDVRNVSAALLCLEANWLMVRSKTRYFDSIIHGRFPADD
jgi:hypothetical protein